MLTSACNVNTGADLEREEESFGGGGGERGGEKREEKKNGYLSRDRHRHGRCLPTIVGFDCLTDSLSEFLLLLSIIHSFEKYFLSFFLFFFFSINAIRFSVSQNSFLFERRNLNLGDDWFET